MTVTWKPKGCSSLSPYLVVDGAQRVIEFLLQAFDALELRRYDMPDGTIMHAEVRIDDTVVMIGTAGRNGRPSPPSSTSTFAMWTPSTDALLKPAASFAIRSASSGR